MNELRITEKSVQAEAPRRGAFLALASLLLLAGIGLLDYITGQEVSFGVFYFLPIWVVTWNFSRPVAILFSFLCALVWLEMDDLSGTVYSSHWIQLWNATARLMYFLTFAFLLEGARAKLQESRREVKELSRLLPICAACKKIRDNQGQWQELEVYIRDHTESDFSHGICPECAKRLYPEYSEELLKKWAAQGPPKGTGGG